MLLCLRSANPTQLPLEEREKPGIHISIGHIAWFCHEKMQLLASDAP